jgi:hypothetical protein
VNIGHFAPFGATPADTAVSVLVNGTVVPGLESVVYGQTAANLSLLPAGTYTVEIVPTGTTTPAITALVPVAADTRYNLYAIGGANGYSLTLASAVVSTTVPPGKALITIGHLAPFASPADATAVNICTDDGIQVPGLQNVKFGDVAANLPFDPGVYDLKVVPAANGCGAAAFDLPPLILAAGDIRDVFAIGLGNAAFPFTVASMTGIQPTNALFFPYIAFNQPNIVQIAQGDPNFSILVEAVVAAGLADDLAGPGPFTVFAPTNQAFELLLQQTGLTKAELLAARELAAVLQYHVLGEELVASQITDGMQKRTLEGGNLTFDVNGSQVAVNGTPIVAADIQASNGVIHVIDVVLLPPTR